MAKKKYLVVHPKHAMNVQLEGQEKAKMQNVPKGTELTLDEALAKSAVKSGKLELFVADDKKAKVGTVKKAKVEVKEKNSDVDKTQE